MTGARGIRRAESCEWTQCLLRTDFCWTTQTEFGRVGPTFASSMPGFGRFSHHDRVVLHRFSVIPGSLRYFALDSTNIRETAMWWFWCAQPFNENCQSPGFHFRWWELCPPNVVTSPML